MSRGIPEAEAGRLIAEGFLNAAIGLIPDEGMRERAAGEARRAIGGGKGPENQSF